MRESKSVGIVDHPPQIVCRCNIHVRDQLKEACAVHKRHDHLEIVVVRVVVVISLAPSLLSSHSPSSCPSRRVRVRVLVAADDGAAQRVQAVHLVVEREREEPSVRAEADEAQVLTGVDRVPLVRGGGARDGVVPAVLDGERDGRAEREREGGRVVVAEPG